MPKGRARAGVVTAFACWLVFLASGDDFNFARIALLPLPELSEDLLPLDDPNSDFTESAPSSEPTTTSRQRGDCASSACQCRSGATFNSRSSPPMHGRSAPRGSNAPLRC